MLILNIILCPLQHFYYSKYFSSHYVLTEFLASFTIPKMAP